VYKVAELVPQKELKRQLQAARYGTVEEIKKVNNVCVTFTHTFFKIVYIEKYSILP